MLSEENGDRTEDVEQDLSRRSLQDNFGSDLEHQENEFWVGSDGKSESPFCFRRIQCVRLEESKGMSGRRDWSGGSREGSGRR